MVRDKLSRVINKSSTISHPIYRYGYKYGLVDAAVFDQLWNKCEVRAPTFMRDGGIHAVVAQWNAHLREKREQLEDERELRDYAHRLLHRLASDPGPRFRDTPECRLAFRKFQMSSSHGLSQTWKDLYVDDYSLFAPVTNQQDDDMAAYMSRADVREALHVAKAPTKTWPDSDLGFDYTKEYAACNWRAENGSKSMIDFYKDIVPRLQITWIYNGDTDPCVSYEGTRAAVKRIGLEEVDGGSYRPWFYNMTGASLDLLAEKAPLFGPALLARDMGPQFGGEIVNYEEGLAFLTVHGSGHMVPQFRPQGQICAVFFVRRLPKLTVLSQRRSTCSIAWSSSEICLRSYPRTRP